MHDFFSFNINGFNGDSGRRRSNHGLAGGVQFDFPSSPARVALAQANVELCAVGTHVLSSTAVVQADEIVLKRLKN